MTYGSLFSGIGGLDLGLDRAGMRCVWQVEKDLFCRRVLAKHWRKVQRWDDVTTFTGEGFEKPDLICGGDPCQGNSNAGSVHKAHHEDLGRHLLRIVNHYRPRFVVRENPAVERADAVWTWRAMRDGFVSIGYAVLPVRIRYCCLGGGHRRERLFLLAALPDTDRVRLERVCGNWIEARHACGKVGDAVPASPRGNANSLPAPRVCRTADGIPNRVDRLRALGNAVVPQVAEYIGRRIMKAGAA